MTCPFCGSENVRETRARQERYRVPNSFRCFDCKIKKSWWTPTPRTRPLRASPMPYLIWDGVRHLQP
jgi:transposase-like protein